MICVELPALSSQDYSTVWGIVNSSRREDRAIAFGISGCLWDDENLIQLQLDRQIQGTQAQPTQDLAIQAERMGLMLSPWERRGGVEEGYPVDFGGPQRDRE